MINPSVYTFFRDTLNIYICVCVCVCVNIYNEVLKTSLAKNFICCLHCCGPFFFLLANRVLVHGFEKVCELQKDYVEK